MTPVEVAEILPKIERRLYYLKHRATDDLDLFCLDAAAFERGPFVLRQVAEETGATLAVRQDAPGFKRFTLTTATEGVVVDLVLDRVPQLSDAKRNIAGVRFGCLVTPEVQRGWEKSGGRFATAMADLLATPNGLDAFRTLFRYISLVAA